MRGFFGVNELKATVKNWKAFQHYKDRKPAWIKLHRDLLDDYVYQRLPVASRALAPMIWLLASESQDGVVDVSPDYLSFRLRMDEGEAREAVKPLIDKGFLIVASEVLAEAERDASLEREEEREEEEENKNTSPTRSDDHDEPVFISIPLVDKTNFDVTESLVTEFQELYPAIDVRDFMRQIAAWNINTPKNRKTRSGIRKHVNAWLAKEQNKARTSNGQNRQTPRSNLDQRTTAAADEARARVLAGQRLGGDQDVGSDVTDIRLLVGQSTGRG